jgi:hypothetical protein
VENDAKVSHNEMLFLQVVSMFQVAAMQQMGKIPNPTTNDIEKDLDQAKMSVDILAMLKEKTKGNLSKQEEEFLAKIVFESQMNYLDELKKPKEEKAGESEDATGGDASEKTGEEETPEK